MLSISLNYLIGKFGKTGKTLAERVSPERKQWVRKESAMILARSIMLREEVLILLHRLV